MRRREFITFLGGAGAWPLAARAQQGERVRRIGMLMNGVPTEPTYSRYAEIFVKILQTLGWRDGQNLRLDIRWSASDPKLIDYYAKELVAMTPDLIVAASTFTGSIAGNQFNSNCIPAGFRADRTGLCLESRASRRQHHRIYGLRALHGRQMDRFAQADGADPCPHRGHVRLAGAAV